MGRKRLPEELKRQTLHITLPKHLIDKLKEKNINISKTVEMVVQIHLHNEYLVNELIEKNINVAELVEDLLKIYLNKK